MECKMSADKFKYTVLYVEDDDIVRENYVNYFERFFSHVYQAASAEKALEIYKKIKPDILVIDIQLPKKSGLEFLKEIREHNHAVRAIMLTAMSDVQTLMDATELKLTKYLVKPIARDELSEALKMAMDEIINFTTYTNRVIHIRESCYWDNDREKLIYDDKDVFLTRKERELLVLLFSNVKKVFSSEDIIYELWYDYDPSKIASLKTLIKNLRKKLPPDTIKNVFGVGYTVEV